MSSRLAVLTISVLLALAPTPLRADEPAPADAHAEMAAALEQQADLVPTPPLLIGESAVPPRRELPPAHKGAGSQGAAERAAHARSDSEAQKLSAGQGEAAKAAASEARQARAAAESAARQDESKRAKDRATQHPHPHP